MADHKQELSDDTPYLTSPTVISDAALARCFVGLTVAETEGATEVDLANNLPPADNLKRFLSVKSVLSTSSSNAIAQQEAAEGADEAVLEEIGVGQCGVVFNIRGTGLVVKRATGMPYFTRQIKPDFESHIKVYKSHRGVQDVLVPEPIEFIEASDYFDWQTRHEAFFEPQYREPACLLVSQRILPLPKPIRTSLIDLFCPLGRQEVSKLDRSNRSCLVRLYLGARLARVGTTTPFSLRNFELTLDRMATIGLEPIDFARSMGSSLATVHWAAKVDGRDIEYVLGSAPTRPEPKESQSSPSGSTDRMNTASLNFRRRTVNMWLLDFNQCEPVSLSEAGVHQCVRAYWDNDPYYPRPNVDEQLWQVFSIAYKERGNEIIPGSTLPSRFIAEIEAKAAMMREGGSSRPSLPPPLGPPKGLGASDSVKTDVKKKRKGPRYAPT
ncbi:zinc finger protein-domain-containing protein [Xylariaceae sp. FL0255]|nr:zinc finger protein-domain-containing protein [Xylariaceae sp. FL0255]